MRYHSIFLLAIAATTAFAQAQNAPQPDGKRLRLSTDSLEIYMVRMGHSQRTGVLVDQLDTVRVNGETLLRRIYRTKDAYQASPLSAAIVVVFGDDKIRVP